MCVAALGIFGGGLLGTSPPRQDALDTATPDQALRIADALVRRGPEAGTAAPAVLRFIERLVAQDGHLQRTAGRIAGALPHLGEAGFTQVVAALRHANPRVRAAMLAALRHGAGAGFPLPDLGPLSASIGYQLLQDPDRTVRLAGLAALAELPREPQVEHLAAALTRSPDDEVAHAARQVVGGKGPVAREVGFATLRRPGVDESDRLSAALALGDGPEALEAASPVIRASLASRERHIRERARGEGSMQFRGWTPQQRAAAFGPCAMPEDLPGDCPPFSDGLSLTPEDLGPMKPFETADAARLAHLARDLREPDPLVRYTAVEDAYRLGPSAAPLVEELAANLVVEDALPWVGEGWEPLRSLGRTASWALGNVRGPAVPALVRLLARHDAGTHLLALGALRSIHRDAEPALPAVRPFLYSRYPAIREAAVKVIAAASRDHATLVTTASLASVDVHPYVRVAGVDMLFHVKSPDALPILFRALRDPDPEVAASARGALAVLEPVMR